MNTRAARRRPAGRTRPSPELVGAALVVGLYLIMFGAGPALLTAGSAPSQTQLPRPSASAVAAVPSSDPLRPGIAGVLEINDRLTHSGEELKDIIARRPFRGSEAAFVLRRIKATLVAAGDRVGALSADPSTRQIGAQLELLYANADTTVEQASDLALGSDREYREAAAQIVDLFRDLPAIDERLLAVLAARSSPSAPPSASPSAVAVASPSAPASPPASASAITSASPSADPAELLRDPGFETGLGAWTRRSIAGVSLPETSAGEPLGSAGSRSLRVDVPATGSLAMVSIGQGPIALQAGARYVAKVTIRAETPRSAQLRVVGPAEETYGITSIEVGPSATDVQLEFLAVMDQPSAMLWVDLGGSSGGTVWLDDASLTTEAS